MLYIKYNGVKNEREEWRKEGKMEIITTGLITGRSQSKDEQVSQNIPTQASLSMPVAEVCTKTIG